MLTRAILNSFFFLVVFGCKERDGNGGDEGHSDLRPGEVSAENLEKMLRQHSNESDLILRLRRASDLAVRNKWNLQQWESEFGVPNVKFRDGPEGGASVVRIEYHEDDEYFVASESYMQGLVVNFSDGVTVSCEPIMLRSGE